MTNKDVRNRLKGVFGFPVTPFRKDLSLGLDGLARNVAEMVEHPFCALVEEGVWRAACIRSMHCATA